jgi:heat shock protein HslJ
MKFNHVLPAVIASVTILSVALTACTSRSAAPSFPLEGTYWMLQSYMNQNGDTQNVLADTQIDAIFEEGNVAGTDGCNRYTASYQINGNKLTIQPGISTLMACPEPIMQQAQDYQAALVSASTYRINGDMLEILDAQGKVVLVFKTPGEISLAGSSWTALSYNNGKQAVVSLLADTEITAVFGEDGKITGSAGCNNYNASYTVDGDSIQIGPAASTRMMCSTPEGVMEQEYAYLNAIQAAASYQLRGDSLTLKDADGSTLAQYTRK